MSSAIIRARSSLDTWRVRESSVVEEGLVVTRIGVRAPMEGVGEGGMMRILSACCEVVSTGGKGWVGAGVFANDRGNSGRSGEAQPPAALPLSMWWRCFAGGLVCAGRGLVDGKLGEMFSMSAAGLVGANSLLEVLTGASY